MFRHACYYVSVIQHLVPHLYQQLVRSSFIRVYFCNNSFSISRNRFQNSYDWSRWTKNQITNLVCEQEASSTKTLLCFSLVYRDTAGQVRNIFIRCLIIDTNISCLGTLQNNHHRILSWRYGIDCILSMEWLIVSLPGYYVGVRHNQWEEFR